MLPEVLGEMRLLASGQFDSISYLTVVLCGDQRLVNRFRQEDLLPLGSRIRTRLVMDYASRDQLREMLVHAMAQAGNRKLMTAELINTLVEHALGSYRTMMTMAGDLLMAAVAKEATQLDEKLYFEVFTLPSGRREPRGAAAGAHR